MMGLVRPQKTIWRMHFAYWVSKTTRACTQKCVIALHGNSGFMNVPQCLLHNMYIASLVKFKVIFLHNFSKSFSSLGNVLSSFFNIRFFFFTM
jgi:hypothetical protein